MHEDNDLHFSHCTVLRLRLYSVIMLKRSSVYFHMNVITFELNPSKQSSTVIRDLANGVTAKVKNANQSIRTV